MPDSPASAILIYFWCNSAAADITKINLLYWKIPLCEAKVVKS